MFLCNNCGLAPDRIYEGENLPDYQRISQPNQYLLIGPKASVRKVGRSDQAEALIGNVDFGVEISDRPNFDMEVWPELLLKLKCLNTGTAVVEIFEKAPRKHSHTNNPVSWERFGYQSCRRSTDPRRHDHKLGVNPRTKLLKLRDPDTSDYGHKHPEESPFRRLRLMGSGVAAVMISFVTFRVGMSAHRAIHVNAFCRPGVGSTVPATFCGVSEGRRDSKRRFPGRGSAHDAEHTRQNTRTRAQRRSVHSKPARWTAAYRHTQFRCGTEKCFRTTGGLWPRRAAKMIASTPLPLSPC